MSDEQKEQLDQEQQRKLSFSSNLASLLNHYSRENGSDTPDFILAKYLEAQLVSFENFVKRSELPLTEVTVHNGRAFANEALAAAEAALSERKAWRL